MTRQYRGDSSEAVCVLCVSITSVPTAHKNTRHRRRSTFTTIRRIHGRTFGNARARDRPIVDRSIVSCPTPRPIVHDSHVRRRCLPERARLPARRCRSRPNVAARASRRARAPRARTGSQAPTSPRTWMDRRRGALRVVWCRRMGKQCVLGRISRYGHGSRITMGTRASGWMNE